ncbi:unnamed protein product [Parajaminaea phylloscopi]
MANPLSVEPAKARKRMSIFTRRKNTRRGSEGDAAEAQSPSSPTFPFASSSSSPTTASPGQGSSQHPSTTGAASVSSEASVRSSPARQGHIHGPQPPRRFASQPADSVNQRLDYYQDDDVSQPSSLMTSSLGRNLDRPSGSNHSFAHVRSHAFSRPRSGSAPARHSRVRSHFSIPDVMVTGVEEEGEETHFEVRLPAEKRRASLFYPPGVDLASSNSDWQTGPLPAQGGPAVLGEPLAFLDPFAPSTPRDSPSLARGSSADVSSELMQQNQTTKRSRKPSLPLIFGRRASAASQDGRPHAGSPSLGSAKGPQSPYSRDNGPYSAGSLPSGSSHESLPSTASSVPRTPPADLSSPPDTPGTASDLAWAPTTPPASLSRGKKQRHALDKEEESLMKELQRVDKMVREHDAKASKSKLKAAKRESVAVTNTERKDKLSKTLKRLTFFSASRAGSSSSAMSRRTSVRRPTTEGRGGESASGSKRSSRCEPGNASAPPSSPTRPQTPPPRKTPGQGSTAGSPTRPARPPALFANAQEAARLQQASGSADPGVAGLTRGHSPTRGQGNAARVVTSGVTPDGLDSMEPGSPTEWSDIRSEHPRRDQAESHPVSGGGSREGQSRGSRGDRENVSKALSRIRRRDSTRRSSAAYGPRRESVARYSRDCTPKAAVDRRDVDAFQDAQSSDGPSAADVVQHAHSPSDETERDWVDDLVRGSTPEDASAAAKARSSRTPSPSTYGASTGGDRTPRPRAPSSPHASVRTPSEVPRRQASDPVGGPTASSSASISSSPSLPLLDLDTISLQQYFDRPSEANAGLKQQRGTARAPLTSSPGVINAGAVITSEPAALLQHRRDPVILPVGKDVRHRSNAERSVNQKASVSSVASASSTLSSSSSSSRSSAAQSCTDSPRSSDPRTHSAGSSSSTSLSSTTSASGQMGGGGKSWPTRTSSRHAAKLPIEG